MKLANTDLKMSQWNRLFNVFFVKMVSRDQIGIAFTHMPQKSDEDCLSFNHDLSRKFFFKVNSKMVTRKGRIVVDFLHLRHQIH